MSRIFPGSRDRVGEDVRGGAQLRGELIAGAVCGAREELARTDAKASTLLTVATGALAGLVTFAHAHIPVPASIALWAGAVLTGAALAVLLLAVRPRLNGARPGDVLPTHGRLLEATAAQLRTWQDEELRVMSRIAVVKYRRVRVAGDLLLAAVGVLAAAVVLIIAAG